MHLGGLSTGVAPTMQMPPPCRCRVRGHRFPVVELESDLRRRTCRSYGRRARGADVPKLVCTRAVDRSGVRHDRNLAGVASIRSAHISCRCPDLDLPVEVQGRRRRWSAPCIRSKTVPMEALDDQNGSDRYRDGARCDQRTRASTSTHRRRHPMPGLHDRVTRQWRHDLRLQLHMADLPRAEAERPMGHPAVGGLSRKEMRH